ncbi:hypothetical protein GLOIN_2v1488088 [Rhizophagus irregularis DAOM 181602=DAOM 197198]|nr:hypothetical protein GLOIN_2v1488088 [Rhizophagus irregularis DAOM 181602=DAOM 197198]
MLRRSYLWPSPSAPKLDIDIDDIPRGEDQQVVSIMRTIIDAFEQEFYDSYNIYPHRKSFTLLDSSGFSRSKGESRPFVLSPYSSQLGTKDVIEFHDSLLVTANPTGTASWGMPA